MLLQFYWSKFFKKIRGKAIRNSDIHSTAKIEAGSEVNNSIFLRHSFCGYNCDINYCEIGSFCSIANNVVIGGGMHPIDWISTSPVFYIGRDSVKTKYSIHQRAPHKKTIIGHDVWIGQNVLIKQGLQIGTGAVIGMGSIVTKNVKPYSIVAGNPARLIRMRFDAEIINSLLDSKWWELSDKELQELGPYIKEPQEFLKQLNNNK